jgi:hypothetical protein
MLDIIEELVDLDIDVPPYSTQIIKIIIVPHEDDEKDLW